MVNQDSGVTFESEKVPQTDSQLIVGLTNIEHVKWNERLYCRNFELIMFSYKSPQIKFTRVLPTFG